jgi:DNA-binding MarR family transcriptional regulator
MSNDQLSPRRTVARRGKGRNQVLDLERYVPGLVTFIANKLARGANVIYQKQFGVSVTEWRILSQLALEPGIPASRICYVIGFDKGPISRTLMAMQKRGMITIRTNPKDARSYSIFLTAEGKRIHDGIIVLALERERRLLGCLRREEREVLIELLVRVHSNIAAVEGNGAAAE